MRTNSLRMANIYIISNKPLNQKLNKFCKHGIKVIKIMNIGCNNWIQKTYNKNQKQCKHLNQIQRIALSYNQYSLSNMNQFINKISKKMTHQLSKY